MRMLSSARRWAALSAAIIAAVLLLAPDAARAARPGEEDYFQLLMSKYNNAFELYSKSLTDDFLIFRRLYPQSTRADSVSFLLARLAQDQKREDLALAGFLRTLYVYPSSPLAAESRQHLENLAGSKNRGLKTLFNDSNMELLKQHSLKVAQGQVQLTGGARGYLDFLQTVADTRVKDLSDFVAAECLHYLYELDYDLEAGRVMVVRGDMFRLQEDWHRALLAYGTAELVEPGGKALPLALNRAGTVYLHNLKNFAMARSLFGQVIERFPADLEAARASLMLAEVDRDQGNQAQAIQQLQQTAERFPFQEIRIEAWARTAGIYLERLDDPVKALEYHEKIVAEYPAAVPAAEALIEIGRIYEDRTKNYAYAVSTYRRLAEMFPDNPVTPTYLLRAAELAEKRLKDQPQAAELYNQLAGRYPESEAGREAAKKLSKK